MTDRVDLDHLGFLIGYPAVKAMRLELLAYRAAEIACREQMAIMRSPGPGQRPAELVAGFEACWKTFADVVEKTLNPHLPTNQDGPFEQPPDPRNFADHYWAGSTGDHKCGALIDDDLTVICGRPREEHPELCPDEWQPEHARRSRPEDCATCSQEQPPITDFGTGCRCPKLGEGTPEHAPGFGCAPATGEQP